MGSGYETKQNPQALEERQQSTVLHKVWGGGPLCTSSVHADRPIVLAVFRVSGSGADGNTCQEMTARKAVCSISNFNTHT